MIDDIEQYLNDIPKFTKKTPFEETVKFYDYLQALENGAYNEEKLGKIIHIAGTNGKGSVCAYLNSICTESGYRTGMFTSPHLITTRERFAINGNIVSEDEFREAFDWLNDKIDIYRECNRDYNPTYFERLFFMGLYIFAKNNCDVTILETGMGGRLDTTNVVRRPAITVITEIGFDHMVYLGDTLEKIAGEKAGIIKSGVPVVFSNQRREVFDVLTRKSVEMGSKYYPVSKKDYKINEIKKKSIDFSVTNLYDNYVSLIINTTALYQVENAGITYRTCEVLKNEGGFDKLTNETIASGMASMHWIGRMDEVRPNIYIDGAHNEDGICAFCDTLKVQIPADFKYRCVVVFSVVKDKQYDKMIRTLSGLECVTDFVITHIPDERGADLDKLGSLFKGFCGEEKKIYTYDNIEDAIIRSVAIKGDKGIVYIVGSLYLAGIVEKIYGDGGLSDSHDKL